MITRPGSFATTRAKKSFQTSGGSSYPLGLGFLLISLMTGCSGSAASTSQTSGSAANVIPATVPTIGSSAGTPTPVAVHLNYVLPRATAGVAQSAVRSRPQSISPSNKFITITVTPFGGATTSTGATPCDPVSCAIAFTTTPGPNTISATLTDIGGKVLSSFTTVTIVQPATINTLRFSANPVVNSVSLMLASPSLNAGTAANDLLTVNAQDIDGNTIVGTDQYVNASGTPVSFSLGVTNAQAGGNGTVSILGPGRITAPSQAAIYAHYDGKWLGSGTINVSVNGSIVGAVTGVTLATTPTFIEYTIPTGASGPRGIVAGNDGALWFAEWFGNNIGRITTQGSFNEYPIPTAASNPIGIASGPDGNLWFTEYNGNRVGRITLAGSIAEFAAVLHSPIGITNGPDGNLWFADTNNSDVDVITPNGLLTVYSAVTVSPNDICQGSDGNLWFTVNVAGNVGRITPNGAQTIFTLPTGGAYPHGITSGPDGNLWFVEYSGNKVGKITTSGTTTEFTIPTAASQPYYIVSGPDQNLWFTEYSGNKIGRITPSGIFNEYTVPTAGAKPNGITVGPDGNIWITEFGTNKIAKFIY